MQAVFILSLIHIQMCIRDRYKEHPEVVNAIGANHDEIEMKSMLQPIVQACDAISGARPGARREDTENYMKRLKTLEDMALSFKVLKKHLPFKLDENYV